MKYKLFAVATVILLLSAGAILLCPDNELKWRDLQDIDAASAARAQELSGNENVTVTDLAAFELLKCQVPEDQLGKYPDDWRSMASSTGITDNISRGWDEAAHKSDLNNAINDSMPLAAAFRSGEATEPFFAHGEAQPVFRFTDVKDGYSNRNSDIIRYCVYVETEYDTDNDGKRDLVRVFVQVPRAAMEGNYKAPIIFKANPYELGILDIDPSSIQPADTYDLSLLYSQPSERSIQGSQDPLSVAYGSSLTEWSWYVTSEFAYYLVRGYAVATCAGLGTSGSEGFQCCGTDIELKSYKSVIDWFNGKAVAFTDAESCIKTDASWSDGKVGMIGISYLGTIQVGLAAMGVDNLCTIVAEGAISNWYDYSNDQGANIEESLQYNWFLSSFCSSRYKSFPEFPEQYINYMRKLAYEEKKLERSYYDGSGNTFWKDRDYTNNVVRSNTSVLFMHGLNDFNVNTKQFEESYRMFSDAGMDVHAILHQGGHQTLHYSSTAMMVGDNYNCFQLLNRWYSCYLFGQSNGISDEFDILVQNNVDGSWNNYTSIESVSKESFSSSSTGTHTVTMSEQKKDPTVKFTSDGGRFVWDAGAVTKDTTIVGSPKISVTASTTDTNLDDVRIYAFLYDVSDEVFPTYLYGDDDDCYLIFLNQITQDGVWVGSNRDDLVLSEYITTDSKYRTITMGAVDMHFPDSDYRSESTYNRITLEPGKSYQYDIYLFPTVYTVEEGHHLELVLCAYNPNNDDTKILTDFSYTLDTSSLTLEYGIV